MKLRFFLASMAMTTLLSACKTSRDLRSEKDRYADPTEIKTLDEAPGRASSHGKSDSSGPSDQQRREMEILQGQLEDLRVSATQNSNALQTRIAELEKDKQSLSEEVLKLRNVIASGATAPVAAAASAGTSAPTQSGAQLLWNAALEALKDGQADKAASNFRSLVKNYPKDSHVFAALIGAGMSFYKTANFKEAALHFNQAVDQFPHRKSGLSLAWFGQGAAFVKMGSRDDGKLFFEELIRRYPRSNLSALAKKISDRKATVPTDLFQVSPRWLNEVQ